MPRHRADAVEKQRPTDHAAKSGVADGSYENDVECLLQMRRLIDFLPANSAAGVPHWPSHDDMEREEKSLDTLIPDNPNKPYDIKELIHKVVDEGDFFEIQAAYAMNIVTGFGRIAGRTVGFVANQPMMLAGVLDSDASRKAARFVRFCDAFVESSCRATNRRRSSPITLRKQKVHGADCGAEQYGPRWRWPPGGCHGKYGKTAQTYRAWRPLSDNGRRLPDSKVAIGRFVRCGSQALSGKRPTTRSA